MHVRMRPSRKTVWLLGAATGLQLSFGLLTGFPSALGETLPGIRILDQKISVQLPSGASSAEVTVTLANDASEAIPLALRAELKSGEASITT
ncbi:MAG: hypothetical protein ACRDH7_12240, partial [Actinomycetota bacterium]